MSNHIQKSNQRYTYADVCSTRNAPLKIGAFLEYSAKYDRVATYWYLKEKKQKMNECALRYYISRRAVYICVTLAMDTEYRIHEQNDGINVNFANIPIHD